MQERARISPEISVQAVSSLHLLPQFELFGKEFDQSLRKKKDIEI